MSKLNIITDNKPRDLIYWHELTNSERKNFDYLETEEHQQDATFFRYKGNVYDLGEFMHHTDKELSKWDGYASDTYFSGVLVKYVDDCERIIVATYYS